MLLLQLFIICHIIRARDFTSSSYRVDNGGTLINPYSIYIEL